MSTELQQRAAYWRALKIDLERKKAHLADAEKALGAASGPFRRDLVTPQCEHWRAQIKILEAEINKAEASGKVRKKKVK